MTHSSPTERQRRLRAAPLALVLLGWGLGAGPLAHAVLAHGEPLLHDGGDWGWVEHSTGAAEPRQKQSRPAHHHAPGVPEHMQLALASSAVLLTVAALVLSVRSLEGAAWQAPFLSRWRLPEVPGAP